MGERQHDIDELALGACLARLKAGRAVSSAGSRRRATQCAVSTLRVMCRNQGVSRPSKAATNARATRKIVISTAPLLSTRVYWPCVGHGDGGGR